MSWLDRILGREQPESLEKALPAPAAKRPPKPESWSLDPSAFGFDYQTTELVQETHPGTYGLDYQTLRAMARVPVISAIIQTRVNQVAEFASPGRQSTDIGFRIRLRDADAEPNARHRREIRQLTRWMQTCGDHRIPGVVPFESFLRQIVRDSLIYDQCNFEIVRTKKGDVAGILPVDASTIRRARVTESELKSGRRVTSQNAYAQVLNNRVVSTFTCDEMVFGIRRPRTLIDSMGYGFPELEELVRVVTNLVNAENYNAANFTHGMHVSGILAVKSKMNPQLFRAFRREFYAMLSGAHNAKKTPIIQLDPENKEELQSVNMSQSNRDMEFSSYVSYLLKLATTVFAMDPAELSFVYGNEGQSHSLNQKSPMDRISASRDRGLRPLLRAVSGWINESVMRQIDPDYVLEFVGFDAKSEAEKLDLDIKSVKAFRTVNELRAMYDMEPLESEVADMVLDPTYINTAWQMASMAEGEEGEEGGGFEEPEEPEEPFDLDSLFGGGGGGFGKSLQAELRRISIEVE